MSTINLLSIILISSLLSACSFHIPKNNVPINVLMIDNTNSIFITEFKKHLDVNIKPSLHIAISNEVQRKQTISYKKNGDSNNYMLTLSVPIKILRGQKVLLSKNLTASITIKKITLLQADTLQIKRSFTQLRKIVVIKLLRILQHLNENQS